MWTLERSVTALCDISLTDLLILSVEAAGSDLQTLEESTGFAQRSPGYAGAGARAIGSSSDGSGVQLLGCEDATRV
ncbi:hypothetical protein OJAV_G00050960 [Oryzias javanicus]|uniref:Uncharacterized protein n=1 Tax=Oryzias javanicus TaxID=123683 RepID=A0A3S2N118_ORYJA|nr:hypothetical protein OJAV_G00050960 [Oryzias javanicus]